MAQVLEERTQLEKILEKLGPKFCNVLTQVRLGEERAF